MTAVGRMTLDHIPDMLDAVRILEAEAGVFEAFPSDMEGYLEHQIAAEVMRDRAREVRATIACVVQGTWAYQYGDAPHDSWAPVPAV